MQYVSHDGISSLTSDRKPHVMGALRLTWISCVCPPLRIRRTRGAPPDPPDPMLGSWALDLARLIDEKEHMKNKVVCQM
jgi:hypothetical protein